MKANSLIAKFKGIPKGVWVIIAACAVIYVIMLIMKGGAQVVDDSDSYIDTWEDISHFNINIRRTPVYPLIIGICKVVFGEAIGLHAVVVVQIIIFLISAWFFYKSSMMITSSKIISFCATFSYAFFPYCFLFNIQIYTESLSTSGMVFLVYLTLKALNSQSFKYPVWMCLVMFMLLFLRPSFLFLVPIYIVGWSILFITRKSHRKLYGAGLIGIALVTLSLVGYACAFKAKYGVFATSNVSIINNYYVCRQYGIIEASVTDNPKLRETIKQFYVEHGHAVVNDGSGRNVQKMIWEEFSSLLQPGVYKLTDLNELVGNSMAMHRSTFVKSIIMRLMESRSLVVGPVKLYVYLVFVLITFCYIVYVAIKRKNLPMVSAYLLSCYLGLYLVSIAGAQNDWGRLTFPVLPCWFLLAAQFTSLFQRNPQRELM